jgi:hypothetical protein
MIARIQERGILICRAFISDSDIRAVLSDVHRKTFFVFLRLSTQKESPSDFMSTPTFAKIIYDNFIFDVSKMIDIASLFHPVSLLKVIYFGATTLSMTTSRIMTLSVPVKSALS